MGAGAPRRALIIGAGPGGLTAAIALHRAGIEVAVFERAPKLGLVGGALGVQCNALRALMRLGIGERLMAAGPEIRAQEFHDLSGKLLFRLPQGEVSDAFGTPSICVLRSELQLALVGALEEGVLRLGSECVGVEQDAEGVTAHFADGSAERGSILIGADGGRSVMRKHVYGAADAEPRYSGFTTWRAVVQLNGGILPQDTIRGYVGPGRQFVMFPPGGERIYWGVLNVEPPGGKDPEGRVHEVLREHMRGFPTALGNLVEATPEAAIDRTDIYDRDPERTWVKDRVVLLGDAAHMTTPFIGQGAGISMEDSVVLAKELALTDGLRDQRMITEALGSYERARIPRCASVVLSSRKRGQTYKWTNPVLIAIRNRVLRSLPPVATRKMLEQSIDYDV
jgi:2-polyprenyl-6-methoxyphenol hydroxylase-like FAD-dependent oxidoreductase